MEKGSPNLVNDLKHASAPIKIALGALFILLIAAGFFAFSVSAKYKETQREFASSTLAFQQVTQDLQQKINELNDENDELSDDLRAEKRRNDDFSDQIDDLAG